MHAEEKISTQRLFKIRRALAVLLSMPSDIVKAHSKFIEKRCEEAQETALEEIQQFNDITKRNYKHAEEAKNTNK